MAQTEGTYKHLFPRNEPVFGQITFSSANGEHKDIYYLRFQLLAEELPTAGKGRRVVLETKDLLIVGVAFSQYGNVIFEPEPFQVLRKDPSKPLNELSPMVRTLLKAENPTAIVFAPTILQGMKDGPTNTHHFFLTHSDEYIVYEVIDNPSAKLEAFLQSLTGGVIKNSVV